MTNVPTILVIDDSATISLFIAHTLRQAGYHVITASNGHEGLTKAVKERPHCVLLDVVMPGISGFSVCRQLRALDPERNLSIIIVSSKNTPLDHLWGKRQGADRYLPKPFTPEVLLQTVEEVLLEHMRARSHQSL